MDGQGLVPSVYLLAAGFLLDAIFGDPQFAFHPIRLLGRTLSWFERWLRRTGLNGYAGGGILIVCLLLTWNLLPSLIVSAIFSWNKWAGWLAHILVVYTLLALRDLVDHVRKVDRAAQHSDLAAARHAVSMFVGRDTDNLDLLACRRASIESLSESFVDGFLSPLFWYVLGGLPGLLLFKIVSTADSMVGYKTPQYLRFGWCGARLDDVMNYVPSRLGWLLLSVAAIPFSQLSAAKGWKTGLRQHRIVPGPNPGWTEATMAGILQRRLIGPIWKRGTLVTDLWLGDPKDAPAGSERDVRNAIAATLLASGLALALSLATIALIR